MEVSSANFSFILRKAKQESWQQFYIRSQAMCSSLDRNSALIAEFDELECMSHYYVASRFMGCRYSTEIHATLKRYFDAAVPHRVPDEPAASTEAQ